MPLQNSKQNEKKPKNSKKLRAKLWEMFYLAPSFLGTGVFYVLPFLIIIYYSVIDNPINPSFVFINNFIALFKNAAFLSAAKNTLTFSVVAVPLAVLLALGLALLLDCKLRMKSLWRTFLLSPMTVPIASVVLIWQVLFHHNGVVNEWVQALGGMGIDWLKSDYNQLVLVLLFLWKNLGYNMILFMAALGSVPVAQIEASTLDGAGSFARFWHIKLRYISSTLLFVTILSLINSFKVFREAYLLGGEYPYGGMYMLQHFMNNTFGSLDYQKLSAAAIIMALVMIAIIGLLFLAENKLGKDLENE